MLFKKWSAADGADPLKDLPARQPDKVRADTQRGLPAPEEGESEYRGDGLREHGAVGGSLDAHIERDDEKGVEKDVAHRADYLRAHGVLWVSTGAHEEICAEAEEREGRSEQDDPQIGARHF